MSKAVLISIKPEWVEKILNGEKTIEIRKTIPKCGLPCKVVIYCTKNRHLACVIGGGSAKTIPCCNSETAFITGGYLGNGKVVAEFIFNFRNKFDFDGLVFYEMLDSILEKACLTKEQLKNYLGDGIGYAWHIDNLKIYDKPKELSEFTLPECEKSECACENCKHLEVINTPYAYETNCVKPRKLTKAPQSWCYVEELGAK